MRVYLIGEGEEGMAAARAILDGGDTLSGISCPVWDRLYVMASEMHLPWWDIPEGGNHGMIPEGTERIVRAGVD